MKDSLYNAEAAHSSIVKDTAVGIRVHENHNRMARSNIGSCLAVVNHKY
jgi:hypothetical protein